MWTGIFIDKEKLEDCKVHPTLIMKAAMTLKKYEGQRPNRIRVETVHVNSHTIILHWEFDEQNKLTITNARFKK